MAELIAARSSHREMGHPGAPPAPVSPAAALQPGGKRPSSLLSLQGNLGTMCLGGRKVSKGGIKKTGQPAMNPNERG